MKYIVAISGGVDSVALLHILKHNSSHELVVAHVDHGIRHDSEADVWHVAALARHYGLPFETTRLLLGPEVSEDRLRQERYTWLDGIRQKHGADGIVTAHHQDDMLETLALNCNRGTGWRGIASLRSSDTLFRPLLNVPKTELVRYAIDNNLQWREDSTNDDIRYTRNYIRHGVVPKLSAVQRKKLLNLAKQQQELREEIEKEVLSVVKDIRTKDGYDRHRLIMMPDSVALEVLREATQGACEPAQLRRLLHFVKTGRQGAVMQIGNGKNALLTSKRVLL
jgi:tRNA(Ile)-lysidine synthase